MGVDSLIINAKDANASSANVLEGRTVEGTLSDESRFSIKVIMQLIKNATARGEFRTIVPGEFMKFKAVRDDISTYGYGVEKCNDNYLISWLEPKSGQV